MSPEDLQVRVLRRAVHRHHLYDPRSTKGALLHVQPHHSLLTHLHSSAPQLSLAARVRTEDCSLYVSDTYTEYQPYWLAGVKAGCARFRRAACKIV